MIIKTQDEYTISLAHYLPSGDLWTSKNVKGSNLYQLLYGLSSLLMEVDQKLVELKKQFYPQNTESFLSEWEELLNIPDGCLKNTGTIEQRQTQIVGCLGALGCVTEEDWINLAKVMGYDIEIKRGVVGNVFPLTLPYVLGDFKTLRNTMTIIFKNIGSSASTFPLILPYILGEKETKFVECIFNRIKPAHIKINYVTET